MTDVAKPGTVLATESIHDQTPDLAWKRKRSRRLKGVDGRVRLFSLGRYEDVRVHADPANNGVNLLYDLVPLHPIDKIEFTGTDGSPGIDVGSLRSDVVER